MLKLLVKVKHLNFTLLSLKKLALSATAVVGQRSMPVVGMLPTAVVGQLLRVVAALVRQLPYDCCRFMSRDYCRRILRCFFFRGVLDRCF